MRVFLREAYCGREGHFRGEGIFKERDVASIFVDAQSDQAIACAGCQCLTLNYERSLTFFLYLHFMTDFTPHPCCTWKCNQCNRRLSTRSQLKYHQSFCHTNDGSKIIRWRCAYCPKVGHDFVLIMVLGRK